MPEACFIDCPAFLAELITPEMRALVPDLDVVVTDPSEDEARAMLVGCRVVVNDHTWMGESLLAACPDLRTIVFMGTGASSYIDLEAVERHGIAVKTISGYGDQSVAEHAVALMFAAARKLAAMDRSLRAGQWSTLDSIELSGKTLGVIGTGGIGRAMVRLGAGLGMSVIAWNRSGMPSDLPCTARELHDLLAEADVVSLHLSLTDETEGILDARRLALLKPSAILVNTARGGLVDEAALVSTLQEGRISHAALDTFAEEPLAPDHPLTKLNNVTLTSHAGFMTREAATRLLQSAYELTTEALAKT
ncbi:MAG: NAD(P)-dependent oxidoreductase [Alphaproteobacteria bacterium]|nr:NAD(P)-dependent oxidoreductase [Alphaproteobacteria bacterium]